MSKGLSVRELIKVLRGLVVDQDHAERELNLSVVLSDGTPVNGIEIVSGPGKRSKDTVVIS